MMNELHQVTVTQEGGVTRSMDGNYKNTLLEGKASEGRQFPRLHKLAVPHALQTDNCGET